MTSVPRRVVLSLVIIGLMIGGAAWLWRSRSRPSRLQTIVTNRTVWGPDFTAVLTSVPAFEALGEDEIVVSHRSVVGSQTGSQEDALSRRARLVNLLRRQLSTIPRLDSLFRHASEQGIDVRQLEALMPRLAVDVVRENGGFRLSYSLPHGAALSPRLSLRVLRAEIGDPDSQSRTVDGGGEGRSRVVTTYAYGDAIRFVTSNYAPIVEGGVPGIERALLKVSRLSSLVAE